MHIGYDKKYSYWARLLIFAGFTLLFYGVFLGFRDNTKLIDPAGVAPKVTDNGESVNISRPENEKSSGTEVINKLSNDDSINTDDYYRKQNNDLRDTIKKEYGITIKYGNEITNYSVGGVDIVPLNDYVIINTALTKLYKILSYYPPDFFNEINKGGIPLSLYLIDSYSDPTVTGVTDSNYNYAIISIAVSYPFEDSFFHESYHYMERYMFKKGIKFISWNSMNPSKFTYGKVDKNYSYAFTHSQDSFFVNTYAQYSEEEDRASTFEYMMSNSKSICFNEGTPIWNKAKIIKETIESVFKTVKPDTVEYWERFI